MLNSISSLLQIYKREFYAGEINNGKSETVPNQAITAKEAVERAMRNIPVPARMTYEESMHQYDGSEEEVDLDQVASQPHFDNELDVQDWHSTLLDELRKKYPTPPQNSTPQEPESTPPEPDTPPNS